MFHPPDKIEKYLKRNYPSHVYGYRMNWLKIEKIDSYNAIHIYSKNDEGNWEIIGTVI